VHELRRITAVTAADVHDASVAYAAAFAAPP
jgi:hypothetical protein